MTLCEWRERVERMRERRDLKLQLALCNEYLAKLAREAAAACADRKVAAVNRALTAHFGFPRESAAAAVAKAAMLEAEAAKYRADAQAITEFLDHPETRRALEASNECEGDAAASEALPTSADDAAAATAGARGPGQLPAAQLESKP